MSSGRLDILMTADAVGGVWTYALDLARGLAGHEVRTTLAVLGPPPGVDQRAAAARVPGLAVVETGLPLDWTAEAPADVLAAGRQVADLARAVSADLVHLNAPALAADAGFGPPVLGLCHSCVATWWDAVEAGPLPPELAWRADLVRDGYQASDRLVAPSLAFARETTRRYGLEVAPTVVPNGRRPSAGGAETGAPGREPFVFTAGRLWDRGKNVATLDRAAGRLAAPVLVAGVLEGPNGDAVDLRHAHPLGRLTDEAVSSHLARRPVFVSVALYEPFGLAVLEAAQAGCPLVLSDIATFRELWDGDAVFVPAEDDRALAAAIDGLLRDPARAASLGDAARRRAASYGIEAMVAGTLAVYRSLWGGRAAAA